MTVKVHYDMYHGYGEMDKAIELLDKETEKTLENGLILRVLSMLIMSLFVNLIHFIMIIASLFLIG